MLGLQPDNVYYNIANMLDSEHLRILLIKFLYELMRVIRVITCSVYIGVECLHFHYLT